MKPGQHDFNTSDGTRIHYLTLGDTGSWVVLIHGYTGNAHGNWFTNGIAQRLAAKHRVVALDCRNHGRSDKPERGGPGNHQDVIELMDHLGIDKAHIHGYSMGGMITSRILAEAPDRFITASFGGSGIREEDEAWQKQVPKDKQGRDPEEDTCSRNLRVSSAMDNGMSREEAEKRVDAAILEAKKILRPHVDSRFGRWISTSPGSRYRCLPSTANSTRRGPRPFASGARRATSPM